MEQLVEDTSSADPNYIEDFLLCHRFTLFQANTLRWLERLRKKPDLKSCLRIFLDSSLEVVRQLLAWFESANLRDRVTRILLLWVKLLLNIYWSWMTIANCQLPIVLGSLTVSRTLLQVNNHFTDFELDSDMMELLDGFESRLESAKMQVPGENNNI